MARIPWDASAAEVFRVGRMTVNPGAVPEIEQPTLDGSSQRESYDYDAFISYRSTARPRANAVKHALETIGRIDDAAQAFRVFQDTSSLRKGELTRGIHSALERSWSLVVLVAKDTVGSSWVDAEIAYWLANGGSSERLFLVRLDEVDLSWEGTGFATPNGLPPALRSAFAEQQSYTNLSRVRGRVDASLLVTLYAAIKGPDTDPEDVAFDVVAQARRRRRLTTLVAAILGLLLVVATAAAIWATVSQRAAQESAVLARSEANAAQAILAGESSAVRSAELALTAAAGADTPNVRAAMLYAADRAGHLLHSIDTGEFETDGVSVFGELLAVTGTNPEGHELRVYEVPTGDLVATGAANNEVSAFELLSPTLGVACQGSLPFIVNVREKAVELNPIRPHEAAPPDAGGEGPFSECSVKRAGDGVVVSYSAGSGDTWFSGTEWVSEQRTLHILDDAAVLVSHAPQALILSVGLETGVYDLAAEHWYDFGDALLAGAVLDVDADGTILVTTGPADARTGWAFVRNTAQGYSVDPVEIAGDVQDAAAIVDQQALGGRFTGDLITISDRGEVRASNVEDGVSFAVPPGYDPATANRPRVVRVGPSSYVAIFANTAAVINIDPDEQIPEGWRTASNGWIFAVVGTPVGQDKSVLRDPVEDVCGDRAILLGEAADGDRGNLIVSADGTYRSIESWTVGFSEDCTISQAGPETILVGHHEGEDIIATEGETLGVTTATQDLLIRSVAHGPLLIYSRDSGSHAWQWKTDPDRVSYRGREGRGVAVTVGGVGFLEHGQQVAFTEANVEKARLATAPDAESVVLYSANWSDLPAKYVTATGVRDVAACDNALSVAYVPSGAFESTRTDAENYVAVGVLESEGELKSTRVVECLTGEPWGGVDPQWVSSYAIDESGGYITMRDPERGYVHVGWTDDGPPTVSVYSPSDDSLIPKPDSVSSAAQPVWSRDGDWLAYADGDVIVRAEGEGWSAPTPVDWQIFMLEGVTFIDEGLLLGVGYNGDFKIVDAATLRTLVRGKLPTERISHLEASSGGEFASVRLETSDIPLTDDGTLTIPISRASLRNVLCDIHRLKVCAEPFG